MGIKEGQKNGLQSMKIKRHGDERISFSFSRVRGENNQEFMKIVDWNKPILSAERVLYKFANLKPTQNKLTKLIIDHSLSFFDCVA